MKKLKGLLPFLSFVCCISLILSACAEDPYKDYVSSGLEPKTKVSEYDQDFAVWITENELKLLTSYSEYKNFDAYLNLGYTEGYFELNSLLVFLKTCCSSDNIKFTDVWENDGKLYPVVESNKFGPDDVVTTDITDYLFYVEVPNSENYSIGEVINKTRTVNVIH